jgi:hypothetical protein
MKKFATMLVTVMLVFAMAACTANKDAEVRRQKTMGTVSPSQR